MGFVIFIMRDRLQKFTIDLLKGMLRFSGEIETPSNAKRIISEQKELNKATEILKWIQHQLKKVDGAYIINDTTNENAKTAAQLYSKLEGEIIGTCFFESPDYGQGDFAKAISPGAKFYRITTRKVCSPAIQKNVETLFQSMECSASLIVIEDDVIISKIGGIFCKLPDKSYLAFIAMDNYGNSGINKGLVFSGSLAEQLFNYYKSFV